MADWIDPGSGEKTSGWKKEISFRRKPKEEQPVAAPAEQPSVWKKEISFRRRQKAEQPVAAPAEQPSVWKKEIHLFGGRAKAESAAPAAPVAAVPVAPAPELPAPAAPEPALVPEPPAVAVPDSRLAPAEEPEHRWLTAPLDEISLPPDEPEAEEEAEPAAESGPELLAVAEPGPEPEAEPAPEPAPFLPPLPAATPPEPVPVVPPPTPVQAAVPARPEPVPVEPKAEKVPLLKRELSLRRKPRAPKEPKPGRKQRSERKRKPEPEQKREPERQPKEKKPPLLKRELSFKRKPRAERAPETVRVARPKRERGASKQKRLVGLKIGASQIAAARVANNGSVELLQVVRTPLEPGVIVGGELRDPEALAAALRDFFRRHKLPKKGVRLGVANNRIGVRTFEISGIDDPKQLENAVRYRAQEVLPIPLEEAVLDYQILSETVGPDGVTTRRILLVVAYRDLVDRYVAACRKAGIHLVGIDLEAFALLRALAPPLDPAATGGDRAAFVAVSVGYDRSTFAVSDGRVCEFTRVLEWGGYALDVGIARALDLTPVEAEEIKYALSLAALSEAPEGLSEERAAAAREAVQRQLQTFARELVSSLQFYQSQPGSLPIGELVLTGGTAQLPGLAAELERLVGVPVRIGDPFGRVKVSKKVREREQTGSFAVAIGLGIED